MSPHLSDEGRCSSLQTHLFLSPRPLEPGVVTSKAALHAQLPHHGCLDVLVDVADLPLGQRPLHVAVGDAVTVAGPVCPAEGTERGR